MTGMPFPSTADVPRRRTRARWKAAVLLAVLTLVTLTGCTRVQVAMAVQPDDTVDGEIVIATPEGNGPEVTVPPELEDKVEISPYDEDGFVGSRASFDDLTFAEVSELAALGGSASSRANLEMRRVGERISVQGRADLTTMAVDRSDVRLAISFPGEIVETDGEADSGTVTWNFAPGEVTPLNASVVSTDPNAPSAVGWTLLLTVLVGVAAGATVLLARRDRNPELRR